VNAEQWNALYPVGTPVFAYPGARPEDHGDVTRLVTRTRSRATVLGGHTDVVWVDGHSAGIALTHVDPVPESVWQAARADEQIEQDRELLRAASKDSDDWDDATWAAWWRTAERHDPHFKRKVTTAAAVAAQGALPVPVGDQPQPLHDTRLAEMRERADAAHPGPWRRSDDEGSLERYVLSEDDLFAVSFGYRGNNTQAEADFVAHAREDVPALLAEVERLKTELAKYVGQEPTVAEEMAYLRRCIDAVDALHLPEKLKVDSISRDYRNGYVHALADMREALELPATDRAEETS
jgi:hypothetical protein